MREALSLPIVSQNISRIYHQHLGIEYIDESMNKSIDRGDLASMLGPLSTFAPGSAVLHAPAGHPPGYIIFGPYWELPAGAYEGEMLLELGPGGEPGEVLCNMDIFDGQMVLGHQQVVKEAEDARRGPLQAARFGWEDYAQRLACAYRKVGVEIGDGGAASEPEPSGREKVGEIREAREPAPARRLPG